MGEEGQHEQAQRVLDPDLLDGLATRATDWVRSTRDDCRAVEIRLGYARRVLQARIDLARAEQGHRTSGVPHAHDDEALVAELTEVLADPPGERRPPATTELYEPEGDTDRGDLVDAAETAALPDLDDAALAEHLELLVAEETRVSADRRVVLEHLDALQAELIGRLRDGSVVVADLVDPDAAGS